MLMRHMVLAYANGRQGNTWAALGGSIVLALYNGGPIGNIAEFIAVSVFYWMIAACIAELASSMPSSSGVYHWASVTAGTKHSKFISYMAGWWNCLAWVFGSASTVPTYPEPSSAMTNTDNRHEFNPREPDLSNVGVVSSGICRLSMERLRRLPHPDLDVLPSSGYSQPRTADNQQPWAVSNPRGLLRQRPGVRHYAQHDGFRTCVKQHCVVGLAERNGIHQQWLCVSHGHAERRIRCWNTGLYQSSCVSDSSQT